MQPQPTRMSTNLFNPVDPVFAYLKDIRLTNKLSSADEKKLAERIRTGDRESLKILVEANLKFVVAVCRRYEGQGLPLADLISEGNLGLIQAARRFDETLNIRFISYAVWWIRQSIMGALARQSRTITVSSTFTTTLFRINQATRRLTQKLQRTPTVEELELETGYGAARIRECQLLADMPLSLDFSGSEDGPELHEGLPDNSEDCLERNVERFHNSAWVRDFIKNLDPRELEVLSLYFGMGKYPAMSLGEIAGFLGMSREGIRQIKKRGLTKLKDRMSRKEIHSAP